MTSERQRTGQGYPPLKFETDYKTGRFLARVISFFGWFLITAAILLAVAGYGLGTYQNSVLGQSSNQGFLGAIVIIVVGTFLGIILVAAGHMMRATMDTANATREMLSIMKL